MTSRRWHWRWVAYLLLAAVVNAAVAEDLHDGSELLEVLSFAAMALLGELWFERRGRLARKHPVDEVVQAALLDEPCDGPHSVTRWRCNGEPAEVETCSPVGTSLEDHLAQHTEAVLEKANELGCA